MMVSGIRAEEVLAVVRGALGTEDRELWLECKSGYRLCIEVIGQGIEIYTCTEHLFKMPYNLFTDFIFDIDKGINPRETEKIVEDYIRWSGITRKNEPRTLFEDINEIKACAKCEDYHRFAKELKDGYSLSILTGSHCDSAELQTVEVALLKDGEFVFGEEDSDESIIHYMDWSTFLDFLGDMSTALQDEEDVIEKIFKHYRDNQWQSLPPPVVRQWVSALLPSGATVKENR